MPSLVARKEQVRLAAATYYSKNKDKIRKRNKENQAKKHAHDKITAYDDKIHGLSP
ncbi:hypothetical protein PILCRDRAFT_17360 [Piloderma croceum F 1598]|uniref:Uncharacterized protein n=1 Tax=Piloderma croceum (strain F 1598) TaxID=765440 RepID=A0A0C3EER3_PILCF|nr:hypothetical protein PILCRDRAFT_17360 [Piloderma croceum F 1598]